MTSHPGSRRSPSLEAASPQPASLMSVHSLDLPCPGCTWGLKYGGLDDLDFCEGKDGCGHFHIEAECPIGRTV